uniref:Uncharacterized protein n=1 Tax=Opuntia streptacantha TaxID=393608 RepID=A0A7C9A339_OPUST
MAFNNLNLFQLAALQASATLQTPLHTASMLLELSVDLLLLMILLGSSTKTPTSMLQIHRLKHLKFGSRIRERLLGFNLHPTSIFRGRQQLSLRICSPTLVILASMRRAWYNNHPICNSLACIHSSLM